MVQIVWLLLMLLAKARDLNYCYYDIVDLLTDKDWLYCEPCINLECYLYEKRIYNRLLPPEEALTGRNYPLPNIQKYHYSLHTPLLESIPDGYEEVMFGMGCFWGGESNFYSLPGIFYTQVGYTAGFTMYPRYEEVKCGRTSHVEVTKVVFNPKVLPFKKLLKIFWENHDPTSGLQQSIDYGSQYRSAIYVYSYEQRILALESRKMYQQVLSDHGFGQITTEISAAQTFYPAEDYHQQYLIKNPSEICEDHGLLVGLPSDFVCGDTGTGVILPDYFSASQTQNHLPQLYKKQPTLQIPNSQ